MPKGLYFNGIQDAVVMEKLQLCPWQESKFQVEETLLNSENYLERTQKMSLKMLSSKWNILQRHFGSVNSSTTRLGKYNLNVQVGKLAGFPTPRTTFNPAPPLCSFNNQLFTSKEVFSCISKGVCRHLKCQCWSSEGQFQSLLRCCCIHVF